MALKLYRSLVEHQVIIPYIQNAFRDMSSWPPKHLMQIDDPTRHDSKTDWAWHPSVHAKECLLGCYLDRHPIERKLLLSEEVSFTKVLTPLMGTVIHTIVQQKLIVNGLVTKDDVEIAVEDQARNWRGHIDLMFRDELIDIKSMRAEKFKFLKFPLDYWKAQLHPYMHALNKDSCIILVIEMGWPYSMKEYRINFEQKYLDEIYAKWEFVTESIKRDIPPDHDDCEDNYCIVRTRFNPSAKRKTLIGIA